MLKNTFLYVSILITLMGSVKADQFIIKLASYTNKASLLGQVSLLEPSIRRNIVIVEDKSLYKLFSQSSQNKEASEKLLPLYRKVFTDAYIMVDIYELKQKEPIDIYFFLQKESNISHISISPIDVLMHPLKDEKQALSFQEILENKTFYLCPQNINSKSEKILIQASFSKDHVNYKTLLGDVPNMENMYTIRKNRLYLINNNRISISQYSTVDQIIFEYMLVSRWYKGKKIHQMRYYKNEEDARSYIQSVGLH